MTAAVQLRRLLYEMTRLEKGVYATGAAVYFVLGLVAVPLFYGRFLRHVDQAVGRNPLAKEISDSIPFDNPFFLAVAAIVAILSIGAGALQMAVIVRLVAWLPPICERIDRLYESIGLPAFGKWPSLVLLVFIKWGILSTPSAAFGCVAGIVLGWLGVYVTPPGFFAVLAFLASGWLSAGFAGIATMVYTPEYEHALPRLIAELRRILKPQTPQDGQVKDAM